MLAGQHRVAAAKELGFETYHANVFYSDSLTDADRLLLQWNQNLESKSGDLSQAIKQIEDYLKKNTGTGHAEIAPFLHNIFSKTSSPQSTNWAQKFIVLAKFPRSVLS